MTEKEVLEVAEHYLEQSQQLIDALYSQVSLEQAEQIFAQAQFWQIIVDRLSVDIA